MNATVKNNLKTFSWLVRREFWENKGLFLWVPVAIAFVLFLLFLTVEILFKEVLSSESYQIERQFYGSAKTALMIIESNKHHVSDMSRFFLQVSLIIGAFLSSFYLLGALHNDRRDRSILFWKSMPVSDISEVFSKLAFPLLMTPLICILFAFCSYFFAGLLVAILTKFGPYDLFSTIMQNMDMYKTPLQLLSLLPFYILWSLPTVGWFLMVSSLAKSRVAPWAVGLPILCTIFLGIVNSLFLLNWDMPWFVTHVLARLITSNIPGSWLLGKEMFAQGDNSGSAYFTIQRLSSVGWDDLSLWLGVAFGIVMIVLAIRLRRHADAVN